MPSPGSPAHRARCATPFSPPWSTLRVTMPSGGHVITVSSLPSARAKSGDSSNLFDLEACPSDLLTRPIGADGHLRVGSVDRHRAPKRSCSALPRARGWPPSHLPVLALKARRGQLPSWYGRSGDLAKPLASSAQEISRARLRT